MADCAWADYAQHSNALSQRLTQTLTLAGRNTAIHRYV